MSKEGYNAKCSECGYEFQASKSIFQEMGILDHGHGSCPKCHTFLNLTFNEEKQEMITMNWDKYLKERKGENNE